MPIQKKYLRLHKSAQKYKKKKGGQDVYDLKRAWKREPLIQKLFPCGDQADRIDLAKLLDRLDRAIEKRYLRMIDSKNHLRGYIGAREIFGNIKGKRDYDHLWDEIRGLIEKEKKYEDHSRGLQRKYGRPVKVVKVAWYWISDELINQLSVEIINHQLSPEIINKLNPEDINQLRKKIIKLLSPEDINQLREEKIKQLREERKFFKGHQPLREKKINEKSQTQDITEEEYKRRFGYYPDLGRK